MSKTRKLRRARNRVERAELLAEQVQGDNRLLRRRLGEVEARWRMILETLDHTLEAHDILNALGDNTPRLNAHLHCMTSGLRVPREQLLSDARADLKGSDMMSMDIARLDALLASYSRTIRRGEPQLVAEVQFGRHAKALCMTEASVKHAPFEFIHNYIARELALSLRHAIGETK